MSRGGLEYTLLIFFWPHPIIAGPGQAIDRHHHNLGRNVVAANNLATIASTIATSLVGVAPPSTPPWLSQPY